MKILLPCGRMEYAPYALDAKPFSFFDGRCCYGKCPRKEVAYRARFLGTGDVPKVCGWASVFGDGFCALEADSQPFSWQTWEPRLRGKNADGEPTYADELVPQSIIDPGTRALVLWLAENRQEPSVAKVKKDGWWAIGEIYYGYFDVAHFTKLAVPDAKGFNGSATRHRFVSTVVEDPEKVERDGPIDVSTAFCGCERCSRFDFRNCLMHGLGGMATGGGR